MRGLLRHSRSEHIAPSLLLLDATLADRIPEQLTPSALLVIKHSPTLLLGDNGNCETQERTYTYTIDTLPHPS